MELLQAPWGVGTGQHIEYGSGLQAFPVSRVWGRVPATNSNVFRQIF